MPAPFFAPPDASRYALRKVSVPACLIPELESDETLVAADLLLENGTIAAIERAGTLPATLGPDLEGSMVLPGLLDCHTHLDKGHIWPRKPNPTGDSPGAAASVRADREARWHAGDVRRRMEFGLATAYAHGVVAIRTHLDSLAPQASISFPVFCEVRDRWADRISLQASSIAPLDIFLTDEGRVLADIVANAGGQLGCATMFRAYGNVPRPPEFDRAMLNVLTLARERNLDIDLHVDETGDCEILTLLRIAQLAVKTGFPGKILCGHCCSLALQTDAKIAETIDACSDAGIAIVSLPTVNMYLQDRHAGTTPRWRGVTLLHELRARGVRVAVAGDNVRDPFYAYGDHDVLDTFVQAVKIAQLDCPIGDWIATVSTAPAEIMRLPGRGTIRAGSAADLIVLPARNYSELLSRNQSDRVVLRRGRAIDTTPPDYRLLDDLMQPELVR
jgi:cytosine deaminase